jgi:hypothetical protein
MHRQLSTNAATDAGGAAGAPPALLAIPMQRCTGYIHYSYEQF